VGTLKRKGIDHCQFLKPRHLADKLFKKDSWLNLFKIVKPVAVILWWRK
jgi:hypothetical protein